MNRVERRKMIHKKQDYISSLFSQIDTIKTKEFSSGITPESSKKRSQLMKRIEKNMKELELLKS